MKKTLIQVFLAVIVAFFAVLACSDVADESPELNFNEVDLRDVAFDTDQTPPDTGAVIR